MPKIAMLLDPQQESNGREVCICGNVQSGRKLPLIVCSYYTVAYANTMVEEHKYAVCINCIERMPEMLDKWKTIYIPLNIPKGMYDPIYRYIKAVNNGRTTKEKTDE